MTERQLWVPLYQLLMQAGKRHDRRRKQFGDAWIAIVYLWSVLHDRPVSWACDPGNWRGEKLAPIRLPSPSTMSRRLNKCLGVRQLLQEAQVISNQWFGPWLCYWIDSKPLTVSGVSKDRDARFGRAAGAKAKGYRIHVLYNAAGAVIHWLLAPMNLGDAPAAAQLLKDVAVKQHCGQIPPMVGYSTGDNLYDAAALYDQFQSIGLHHVAPPRKTAKQLGHRPQSPQRLRGLDWVKRDFGQNLLHARGGMERFFANATSFAGGMGPLPAWVRRPRRVSSWVSGKLLIDAVRRAQKQRLAA